jgi:predicted HicB family RNase H-like nuclease
MSKPSDRYLKIVEWSDEDRCYVGRAPGLMLGGVHGKNERKVFEELCQAINEWVALEQREHRELPMRTAGRRYSGRFVVRVPPTIHERLSIDADRQGLSLNQFCERLLANR